MIISIKSGASGGSSRGLVHYLAHSKLDKEREGKQREFFNESENDLTVARSNRYLSRGRNKPQSAELMHLVVAPSQDEFESLGEDSNARKTALQSIVRKTVAALKKSVNAKRLKWIAVLHLNTAHAHAHVAVQKEFQTVAGETQILRVERELLHYNEQGANGAKVLRKGALITAAENVVRQTARQYQHRKEVNHERQSDIGIENALGKTVETTTTKTSPNTKSALTEFANIADYKERRVLAAEMLTASEVNQRTRNIEILIEHSDKKRFKIKDETIGRFRHVSLFDIEQKIEVLSRRESSASEPKNEFRREEIRRQIASDELAKHEPTILQLKTIHQQVLGLENRHLDNAKEKHTRLNHARLLIEKKRERLNLPTLIPIFTFDEIQRLQRETIENKDSEKLIWFENVRLETARELNQSNRRKSDVRELLAWRNLNQLKAEAAKQKLLGFQTNKNLFKIQIEDNRWSLQDIERRETQSKKKQPFWTRISSSLTKRFSFVENSIQTHEKPDFQMLRTGVESELAALEAVKREDVQKHEELYSTLQQIFERESRPDKHELTPAYTARELIEIEDLARGLGNDSLYENSLPEQERFLRENLDGRKFAAKNQNPPEFELVLTNKKTEMQSPKSDFENNKEKIINNFLLTRSAARVIIIAADADAAREKLTLYQQQKHWFKHRSGDETHGSTHELSLADVSLKTHYYLVDSLLERAFETRSHKQLRLAVEKAVAVREKELIDKTKKTQDLLQKVERQSTLIAERDDSKGFASEIQPVFTPKEIAALEIRASKTHDKSEAVRLKSLIEQAEKNNRVERGENFLVQTRQEIENLAFQFASEYKVRVSKDEPDKDESRTLTLNATIQTEEPFVRSNERAAEPSRLSDDSQPPIEMLTRESTLEKGRTR